MTRDEVLHAIRVTAKGNAGRPLGEKSFYRAANATRTDLWNSGFARYSEAVAAAGLEPNKLIKAAPTEKVMEGLIELVRGCGRFPTIGDVKTARRQRPWLPSYEALKRIAGGSLRDLPQQLLDYCKQRPEFDDVVRILGVVPHRGETATSLGRGILGYVYLAKHGKNFKIGRSNDVVRRRREVALLLPEELKHVHVIETDDPEGIEAYWHRRFAERRGRGEWFQLTAEDVAAFRRRRFQ